MATIGITINGTTYGITGTLNGSATNSADTVNVSVSLVFQSGVTITGGTVNNSLGATINCTITGGAQIGNEVINISVFRPQAVADVKLAVAARAISDLITLVNTIIAQNLLSQITSV